MLGAKFCLPQIHHYIVFKTRMESIVFHRVLTVGAACEPPGEIFRLLQNYGGISGGNKKFLMVSGE